MTLTLELTPEQEAKLRARAEALGLATGAYLLHLAERDDAAPEPQDVALQHIDDVIPPGQSLADALAGRIGRVHSGGRYKYSAKDSGRAFAEMMVEKKKQGRL